MFCNVTNSFVALFLLMLNGIIFFFQSKGKELCGDTPFHAARSSSSRFKNQDDTGLLMGTCRHQIIHRALNMERGETFDHTHFLHSFFSLKGFKFICNDVICRYWPYACKVSRLLPQFEANTKNMKPFLSRMHAKCHTWYCQVKSLFNIHIKSIHLLYFL